MGQFPFDTSYDPAMPVCEVTISVSSTGRRSNRAGIIDTGADATLIPAHILHELGARRAFETGLRSQWGERRTVFLYLVDIQIEEVTLPGIYVVGDEIGDEVILGRDVINRLRLLLDGPAALLQLLDDN
jgi:predicted aspartyl protease